MKIVIFGECIVDYNRTSFLIKCLQNENFQLLFFIHPIQSFFLYFIHLSNLLKFRNEIDFILLTWPRYNIDFLFVKLFSVIFNIPIIIEPMISEYYNAVYERKYVKKNSIFAKFYYFTERIAIKYSDLIIFDTYENSKFLQNLFKLKLKNDKYCIVYVGSIEQFSDVRLNKTKNLIQNKIGFIGNFTPLQGVDIIVEVADYFKDDNTIKFELVGKGMLFSEIKKAISERKLTNIELLGLKYGDELIEIMSSWQISLGIFGNTNKTKRVVPNKIFNYIEAGIPVITLETKAVNELFTDKKDIFLVKRSPDAIVNVINTLLSNQQLSESIVNSALRTRNDHFSISVNGKKLSSFLKNYFVMNNS